MTTPKLDILKRYRPRKAKKRKASNERKGLKVVVESDYIPPNHPDISESLDYGEFDEDAPIIAGIIDERPDDLKAADGLFGRGMWKAMSSDAVVDKPSKDFQGIRLEIGQRLSNRSFKAAQKILDIARRVLVGHCDSNAKQWNQEVAACTGWRNLEVLPNKQQQSPEMPQKPADTDSDLSPERPAQSERVDTGRRVGTTVRRKKAIEDDIEARQKREERYKMWSRGLAQIRQSRNAIDSLFGAKGQPLARYSDDKELEDHLKKQIREGDPMAKFIKSEENVDTEAERPRCKYTAPPNRFGIEPGLRWDGVDRSNGFERKVFNIDAGRKSIAEHAYKWRVEDM